jgi:glycerol uptake facilitator-like aquaporin
VVEEEWKMKEKNVRAWSVMVNCASFCAGEVSDNCLPPVFCFFLSLCSSLGSAELLPLVLLLGLLVVNWLPAQL